VSVLAIECSTRAGSIAVHGEEGLLFIHRFDCVRGQSSGLFEALQRALEVPGISLLVVGLGPGSYAGVRVALSAASGIALVRNLPLRGAVSLAALPVKETTYRVAGDARRESFHHALVEAGRCIEGPELLDAAQLSEKRTSAIPFYATSPLPGQEAEVLLPDAARLAENVYLGKTPLIPEDTGPEESPQRPPLEPLYLRDPYITLPKAR
jgi:tRNA threonylcarbamoyladenosine biosynthesis protein TsaB